MRQRSCTIGRPLRRGYIAIDILVTALRNADLHQLQRPGDSGQQIIEVVREPARKLADRLHLLGLPQSVFRLVERVLLSTLLRDIASHAIQ